jgi:hypothetical protein
VKELESRGNRVVNNVELRFEGICGNCLQK